MCRKKKVGTTSITVWYIIVIITYQDFKETNDGYRGIYYFI